MTSPFEPPSSQSTPAVPPGAPTHPVGASPAPSVPAHAVPPQSLAQVAPAFGATPPQPRPPRRWLLPTITGVAGLVVGGAVVSAVISGTAAADGRAADEAAVAVLGDAVDACEVRGASGFVLGDGGLSLTIDNKGEDDVVGADFLDISCVFGALAMPASVSSHVGQTTSMDGRQTAEWDNLELQWSYHPDRGMDGVITVVESP